MDTRHRYARFFFIQVCLYLVESFQGYFISDAYSSIGNERGKEIAYLFRHWSWHHSPIQPISQVRCFESSFTIQWLSEPDQPCKHSHLQHIFSISAVFVTVWIVLLEFSWKFSYIIHYSIISYVLSYQNREVRENVKLITQNFKYYILHTMCIQK